MCSRALGMLPLKWGRGEDPEDPDGLIWVDRHRDHSLSPPGLWIFVNNNKYGKKIRKKEALLGLLVHNLCGVVPIKPVFFHLLSLQKMLLFCTRLHCFGLLTTANHDESFFVCFFQLNWMSKASKI